MLAMDLFLAISLGIGVALACGFRPFTAALVIAAMARADLGISFDGTGWEFLQSVPVIAGAAVLAALMAAVTSGLSNSESGYVRTSYAVVAATIGALEFAGALASEGYAATPGIVGGAVCAALGFAALRSFVGGARTRLAAIGRSEAGGVLTAGEYLATFVTVVLAVLIPPLSYVPFVLAIWVLASRRRRAGKKYEGLRVLR